MMKGDAVPDEQNQDVTPPAELHDTHDGDAAAIDAQSVSVNPTPSIST